MSETSCSQTPIGAMPAVPATDETRRLLGAAGIVVSGSISELDAQRRLDGDPADAPGCYGRELNQVPRLCAGCVFLAPCERASATEPVQAVADDVPPPPPPPKRRKARS